MSPTIWPWNRGRVGRNVVHRFGCKHCPRTFTYEPEKCRDCGSTDFRRLET